MKHDKQLLLCSLILASGAVQAADGGSFYEGIGVGTASYDLHLTEADRLLPFKGPDGHSISQDQYTFDTNDQVLQLFAGYRFNRYVAVELSLADLGAVDRDGTFNVTNGGPLNGTLISHTSIETRGIGAAVLGIWPITPAIDVYGRAGLFNWSIRAPFTVVSNGNPFLTGKSTDHGTDPFIGVGAAYKWDIFSVRVEYQRYKFSRPFNVTNDANANVLTASLLYNF